LVLLLTWDIIDPNHLIIPKLDDIIATIAEADQSKKNF
jgi:hypothetical protein